MPITNRRFGAIASGDQLSDEIVDCHSNLTCCAAVNTCGLSTAIFMPLGNDSYMPPVTTVRVLFSSCKYGLLLVDNLSLLPGNDIELTKAVPVLAIFTDSPLLDCT